MLIFAYTLENYKTMLWIFYVKQGTFLNILDGIVINYPHFRLEHTENNWQRFYIFNSLINFVPKLIYLHGITPAKF